MIFTLFGRVRTGLFSDGKLQGSSGMFAIFSSYAIYNDRDGIAGRRIKQVSEYVYETEALAHRMKPNVYANDIPF
jgi:hypothetical protein